MSSQREEALNTELARLLTLEPDVESAVGERKIGGGKSIDVLITVRKLQIAAEAKLAKSGWTGARARKARSQAGCQAVDRVREGHADFAVSVLYPPGTTSAAVSAAELEWNIAARGAAARPVHCGTVSEFAVWLTRLTDNPDSVVALLLEALEKAAGRLAKPEQESLVDSFGIKLTKGALTKGALQKATVRMLLMVAAAVMFHSRIQSHLKALDPPADPQKRKWPPKTPFACANAVNPVVEFNEAWQQILLVDYKPVFESACGVLTSRAHTGHNFTEAVRIVAKAGLIVAGTAASLRHDLLGRVFHRVLDTARYDGSFYTSSAAAALLAGLALTEDGCDWADPDAVSRLRICDPCCGSGTLLMAASERIRDLRAGTGDNDPDVDYLLGAMLIEDVLWAYDINIAACHLTATTLGLLAPSVDFLRMNVFRTRLGIEGGDARLGSLDLLASGGKKTGTGSAGTQLSLQPMAPGEQNHVETGDDQKRASNPPAMDLVIMNPPFTRDSLRHDQHTRADELKIKAREQALLKDHQHREAARLHSSDGMFLLLGEHLCRKTGGGTVALVLPAVVATSGGALARRKFLSEQFHVEHVIASHDPKRIAFSENTAISEMLVVARRHPAKPKKRPPTKFVKLLRNPDNPADSNLLAGRIATSKPGAPPGSDSPFAVYEIPSKDMAAGDWQTVGFLSGYLYEQWRELVGGSPMLDDIAKVGPAGQRIRDAYAKWPLATGRQALWNHKAKFLKTLSAAPDTFIEPKPGKNIAREDKNGNLIPGLADRYWAQRSRLLIANRLNLPTMRVAVVLCDTPAVGSAFCPIRPKNPDDEKPLAVWFNSTLGLLGIYGARSLRKLPYPTFGLAVLRSLPVPDLNNSARTKLTDAFDLHKNSELLPFPRVGAPPHGSLPRCATRAALDKAVCEALGYDPAEVANTADALAAEPSITDRQAPLP